MNKITEIERSKILQLYKTGVGCYIISKKLNISKSTIFRILKKEDNILRNRVYNSVNHNYFNKLTHEKAWLIGFIAADGCIGKDKKHYRLHINQSGYKGLQLLKYIKKILNFSGPIYKNKKRKKSSHAFQYSLLITSPKIIEKLSEYNIVPRKSLTYKFPEKIIPYLYSFLRGYVDGDGCVSLYKKKYLTIEFVGSKKFIDRCQTLIPIKSGKYKINNCWKLNWQGKKAVEFCKLIFINKKLYTYYKKEKYINFLTNPF